MISSEKVRVKLFMIGFEMGLGQLDELEMNREEVQSDVKLSHGPYMA